MANANPFMQPQQPMQVTIEAPHAVLDIMELRMEEVALTITRMVDPVVPHLTVIVDAPMLEAVRAVAAQVDESAKVSVMKLADIDWVTQVQKDFPPFRLGRFYVYGSHAKDTVPHNRFPLLIDAVAAFGTGEHDTTAGCLLALEEIKKKRKNTRSVLDVGCGTVILGIGAARLWKDTPIEACDNDPVAVRVSQVNLRANQIQNRAKACVSDGYKYRPIQKLPPQEIIVANILAKPLMKMSRDAVRKLRDDGVLILSGLLNSQENMVLAAHRVQGLRLKKRIRRGKWSILVLAR
jgi:ribosomal protein L11 methyltransferase